MTRLPCFPLGMNAVSSAERVHFFLGSKLLFQWPLLQVDMRIFVALINRFVLLWLLVLLLNLIRRYNLGLKGELRIWVLLMLKLVLHFLLNNRQVYLCFKGEKLACSSVAEQVRGQYEESPFDLSAPPLLSIQYLCCVL